MEPIETTSRFLTPNREAGHAAGASSASHSEMGREPRRWRHARLGILAYERQQGHQITVKIEASGRNLQIAAHELRGLPEVDHEGHSVSSPAKPIPTASLKVTASPSNELPSSEVRMARRVVESARRGLPSRFVSPEVIGVGCGPFLKETKKLFEEVEKDGGGVRRISKSYGEGKTFDEILAECRALASGFVTSRFEVEGGAQDVESPANFCRLFMQNLRFPDVAGPGFPHLLIRIQDLTKKAIESERERLKERGHSLTQFQIARFLEKFFLELTGCEPLAWLLSDPAFSTKEELVRLLLGDRRFSVADARSVHILGYGAAQWPSFRFGTQADFACYLLSGVGRLIHSMGYKGTILCVDEGDFWQRRGLVPAETYGRMNSTANLACGLVWAITAKKGERSRRFEPKDLYHSGLLGPFDFTTSEPCHLGLVLTETPRSEGDLLPKFGAPAATRFRPPTPRDLEVYAAKFATYYATAYELSVPSESQLASIAQQAAADWIKEGVSSIRTGVECVVLRLDRWRAAKLGVTVDSLWG